MLKPCPHCDKRILFANGKVSTFLDSQGNSIDKCPYCGKELTKPE